MNETLKWQKSGVRKNRYFIRVVGKRVVIERGTKEWLLTEDGRRVAGAQHPIILFEIAKEHYTTGLDWRQALAVVETRMLAVQEAQKIAAAAKA